MMSDQTKTVDAGEAPPASDMPLPSETILASAAQQEISGVRRRLQEMVGEVVLAMAQLPRYRLRERQLARYWRSLAQLLEIDQ